MSRPLAYDIARMIAGAANGVPRGIDRVDFGWLSHLFENWPGDCHGLLPTPWGTRVLSRESVLRGRDRLARIWRERDLDEVPDPALARLNLAFAAPPNSTDRARRPRDPDIAGWGRALALLGAFGPWVGRSLDRLPEGTIYVDVSQRGLVRPSTLTWLARRRDLRPVVFIHDVIPLAHPEFVTPSLRERHGHLLDAAARHAHAVVTSTPSAAEAIGAELAARGRADLPVHVRALPIDDVFRQRLAPDPALAGHPYFLVCGAVARRKNQEMLIEVWAELLADRGAATPRLVIAGSSDGAHGEALRSRVAARGLATHVVFASGLSTPSIARLMAGARALLMPSRAEGFGLPPLEAMATGTPAVVSDIPAHRDAAGDAALFVSPDDRAAWRAAIEDLTTDTPLAADSRSRATRRPVLDWRTYMTEVTALLADLG